MVETVDQSEQALGHRHRQGVCESVMYMSVEKQGNQTRWTYGVVLQQLFVDWDWPYPTPACQPSARSVVDAEVVAIANTCDLSEDTSLSEEPWADISDGRYAPKVASVESVEPYARGCEDDCRDEASRLHVGMPIPIA